MYSLPERHIPLKNCYHCRYKPLVRKVETESMIPMKKLLLLLAPLFAVGMMTACSGLESLDMGDGVTAIESNAFLACEKLTSITIPAGVTTIGEYAFFYCESLVSVYSKPTTPPAGGSDMFSYNSVGRKIYVPTASLEAYKSAAGWSEFASDIEGYDF